MSSERETGCRIYLYEDDQALAGEIIHAFADQGHDVQLSSRAADISVLAQSGRVLVLIMDRMVEGLDSLGIIEALRALGNRVPVVVISSLASVDDRIRGLRAGGDDYLIKPFAMGELIARVEALRRRADEVPVISLTVGPLVLDLLARTVRRGSREIDLLPKEFNLLKYMMQHSDQVVTRTMLLENVWHLKAATQTNVVDVHVGNLRRKIDGDGEEPLISSVRGLGFKLSAPVGNA